MITVPAGRLAVKIHCQCDPIPVHVWNSIEEMKAHIPDWINVTEFVIINNGSSVTSKRCPKCGKTHTVHFTDTKNERKQND